MLSKIHDSFLLNNKPFNEPALKIYAGNLIITEEGYLKDLGYFLLDWLNDESFIIVKTSGSTGMPKSIKVKKEHMINSAKATGDFFKMHEGSSALLCLSANYIAGKMMLVRAMVLGWKLDVVAPQIDPLNAVDNPYDFCAMVPMQLDNSIKKLHLLKKLIVGGGAVPEYLMALIQGVKTKIYETYGMTETVSHIAARRINPKNKTLFECFFKTLPQIEISVDYRNCLQIKAPLLCDDVLITNDIVELITRKKFTWKGRFDNVINSGGIKLFPEQIEKKMQLVIRHRFFVTSKPDDQLGDKLILIIENTSQSNTKKLFFEKIKQVEGLAKYERPKEIYFLEHFTETKNGKVQRKINRERALQTSFINP